MTRRDTKFMTERHNEILKHRTEDVYFRWLSHYANGISNRAMGWKEAEKRAKKELLKYDIKNFT